MNAVSGTPASPRRVFRAVLVMVCALGLLAATSGGALAKTTKSKPKTPTINTHTPIIKGSTYLALGDSYTFGYEEAQVVPAPNYSDASSFLGYPELLGSALHLNVVNAACPGETSASFIDPTAPSNGCENTPGNGNVGYRTLHPLHVSYNGSQLGFAVSYLKKHHNVRLVSLLIGGNDLLLCQETTADHCASLTEQAGVITTAVKNTETILSAIRNKAHYGGQIALLNYYSPTASLNAVTAIGDQAFASAGKPSHAVIADAFGQFNAADTHSGGNPCTAGLLTQLSGGGCGIHPSYAGHALLAQAVEQVIRLG